MQWEFTINSIQNGKERVNVVVYRRWIGLNSVWMAFWRQIVSSPFVSTLSFDTNESLKTGSCSICEIESDPNKSNPLHLCCDRRLYAESTRNLQENYIAD